MRVITAILVATILLSATGVLAQRPEVYSKERPLMTDFDMEDIPKPRTVDTGYLYDWIDGTLFQQVRKGLDIPGHFKRSGRGGKESINVNTFDLVPDSSWFTNRAGSRPLTAEEIARGPNSGSGPKPGKLTVLRGKNIGATPGFWVRDEAGDTYILKFDPPGNPEMASGAEVIATRFFWAVGYNVPENFIFRFRREWLEIGEGATFTNDQNKKEQMTEAHLELILSKVAGSGGSYRALASKLIKGSPLGGFTFSGRRKDDPNDIIPHELRRDVRALRVFSAWTEHNDIRVGNTLDMYVEEDGRRFVKHYLIDFGSTFGSDTIGVNEPEVGREYRFDTKEAAKVFFTGGVYKPKWRRESYDPVFSPAVGRYSAKGFRPHRWKQNFPLNAFGAMTDRDGFWAARIVASFTPEQILAIVRTAEFSDPADTEYLATQIVARQRLIVQHYAQRTAGIGDFRIADGGRAIEFTDYRRLFPTESPGPSTFEYSVEKAEGANGISLRGKTDGRRLTIDDRIAALGEDGDILKIEIGRTGEDRRARLYVFKESEGGFAIAGIVH